jgi:Heparan-alpha-glucosaminide N-acetyltransferase, catalytic
MDYPGRSAPEPRPARPDAVGRLQGLDQARAVAIIAMILAHFAEGVFARLPGLASLHDPTMWFGRMATPAFMTIFGVTAGFVFLPRYLCGYSRETTRRLLRRAALVFLWAILITVPQWIRFANHGETDVWEYVFVAYSVLLFYTLGVALLPFWLSWLASNTILKGILGGAIMWGIGTTIYYLWPQQEKSLPEFIRLMLVSGNYGYFQMMGTTLLAIPVGLQLRRSLEAGNSNRALVNLLVLGLAVSLIGAAAGFARGEFEPARIISGELRIPPRVWYFMHFGGIALAAIPILEFLTRLKPLRGFGYLLALFGQTSLLLFAGNQFVLPAIDLIDHVAELRGIWRVGIPLSLFALFCAVVMYFRHRQNERKAARKSKSVSKTISNEPASLPR